MTHKDSYAIKTKKQNLMMTKREKNACSANWTGHGCATYVMFTEYGLPNRDHFSTDLQLVWIQLSFS